MYDISLQFKPDTNEVTFVSSLRLRSDAECNANFLSYLFYLFSLGNEPSYQGEMVAHCNLSGLYTPCSLREEIHRS